MVLVPIVVWLRPRRSSASLPELLGLTRTSTLPGFALGLLIVAVMLSSYYIFLKPLVDPAPLVAKVNALGIRQHYWLMALFISLLHSFFEEYYWRAFILTQLRSRIRSVLILCLLGGALFSLHHIFALVSFLPLALLILSLLAIAIAGSLWTWMRLRGYSIIDCYISHVFADLAVMYIGYDLLITVQ